MSGVLRLIFNYKYTKSVSLRIQVSVLHVSATFHSYTAQRPTVMVFRARGTSTVSPSFRRQLRRPSSSSFKCKAPPSFSAMIASPRPATLLFARSLAQAERSPVPRLLSPLRIHSCVGKTASTAGREEDLTGLLRVGIGDGCKLDESGALLL